MAGVQLPVPGWPREDDLKNKGQPGEEEPPKDVQLLPPCEGGREDGGGVIDQGGLEDGGGVIDQGGLEDGGGVIDQGGLEDGGGVIDQGGLEDGGGVLDQGLTDGVQVLLLCPVCPIMSLSVSQLPRAPMTKPSTSTLRKPLDLRSGFR